jgi:ubiquinone/menaquinone biosynthesis C-methylase UbiE
MEATQIDAGEFRARQRRDWEAASQGWRDWHDLISTATRPVSLRLIEMAEVEPGNRVLDVGTGPGEPALTAAEAVGPEGNVVASDLAPAMLAFAQERASAAGLDNVELVEGAASSLDFPEGSFDAALSRWGIIFEPEAEAAAGRIRGFLRPGSKMAIASWGPPDRVPMIALPMMTLVQRLGATPPPPGTPGPLSRPSRDAIAGLLEGGGFSDVEVDELEIEFEWPSAEEFTRYVKEIAPPVSALVADHPPDVQEDAWNTVTEAARAHATADGTVRMSNLALVAAGRA